MKNSNYTDLFTFNIAYWSEYLRSNTFLIGIILLIFIILVALAIIFLSESTIVPIGMLLNKEKEDIVEKTPQTPPRAMDLMCKQIYYTGNAGRVFVYDENKKNFPNTVLKTF